MKARQLTLPYDVPANEFMNLEGKKISGSRNWAIWGRDFLTRYDPDPLRYYLTANMPESKDTDWDWEDFVHRNNDELVATWGNLANRVLSFATNTGMALCPASSASCDPGDQEILAAVEAGFQTRRRASARRAPARRADRGHAPGSRGQQIPGHNRPLVRDQEDKAPRQPTSVYTALRAIDSLKILFAPFLPFTSEALHTYLGYTQPLFGEPSPRPAATRWASIPSCATVPGRARPAAAGSPASFLPGRRSKQPAPLFRKLDEKIVEEERARLG